MALEPKPSESARAGMAQAREERQKAREAARDVAVKGMRERQREQDEANAESYRRMNASTPTPTQEENDLARIGALDIDKKQDDGSGPDRGARQVRRNVEAGAPAPYTTRDVSAKN
jgi:hypothetical protein